jgi:hypothetical protein
LKCSQEDQAINSNEKEILAITKKNIGRNLDFKNSSNIQSFAADPNYKSTG